MDEKLDPQGEPMDPVVHEAAGASRRLLDGKGKTLAVAGGLAGVAIVAGVTAGAEMGGGESAPHPVATHSTEPFTSTAPASPAATLGKETAAPADVSPTDISLPKAVQSPVMATPVPNSTVNGEVSKLSAAPSASPSHSPEQQQTDWAARLHDFGNNVASQVENMKQSPDWQEQTGANGSYPGSVLETFTRPTNVSNDPNYDGQYRFEVTRDKTGSLLEVALKEVAINKADHSREVILHDIDIASETNNGKVNWVGYVLTYDGKEFAVQGYANAGVDPDRPTDKVIALNANSLQTYENTTDNIGERANSSPPQPLNYPQPS